MRKHTKRYETADLRPQHKSEGSLPDDNLAYAKLYHFCMKNGIEPPTICELENDIPESIKSRVVAEEIERLIGKYLGEDK